MEQEFINVDDDGLNPPEGSFPDFIEGAAYYVWNPQTQVWEPVFEE